MSALKPGTRLKSAVCTTEIMVVKGGEVETLTCGGVDMLAPDQTAPATASADPEHMHGCLMGKRYVSEDETVEVLCVKQGEGSLGAGGALLLSKETKKLPSSD